MRLRELRDSDLPRLRELHALQQFEYAFPDVGRRDFVLRLVWVDENDQAVSAVLARQTVELYFITDRHFRTPRWRFEGFRLLHEHVRVWLEKQGYSDAHCWIPPQIQKSFGRRLISGFGWQVNDWLCLSRETKRKRDHGPQSI